MSNATLNLSDCCAYAEALTATHPEAAALDHADCRWPECECACHRAAYRGDACRIGAATVGEVEGLRRQVATMQAAKKWLHAVHEESMSGRRFVVVDGVLADAAEHVLPADSEEVAKTAVEMLTLLVNGEALYQAFIRRAWLDGQERERQRATAEIEALRKRLATIMGLAEEQSHHYDCRTVYGEKCDCPRGELLAALADKETT